LNHICQYNNEEVKSARADPTSSEIKTLLVDPIVPERKKTNLKDNPVYLLKPMILRIQISKAII
jgi:hypothetical protein